VAQSERDGVGANAVAGRRVLHRQGHRHGVNLMASAYSSPQELHLPYWVAQVRNADARDHRRVAKDGWRAGEVVEESNAGAKKNRRDVDADFVEEAAFRSCWMVSAPWTPTDFPAAAALAWFTALSMPSVTKWTVELGRGHPAGMWWVSTNAGPQA
jgi:hypothetical protein